MFKIRRGTFETNSSSTHTLIMCSDEEYQKLENGEFLIAQWNEEVVSKEEIMNDLKKRYEDVENINNFLRDEGYVTLEEFYDNEYLEGGHSSYTLPDGQKVHALYEYGWDG